MVIRRHPDIRGQAMKFLCDIAVLCAAVAVVLFTFLHGLQ